jgi:hypothetical protein
MYAPVVVGAAAAVGSADDDSDTLDVVSVTDSTVAAAAVVSFSFRSSSPSWLPSASASTLFVLTFHVKKHFNLNSYSTGKLQL